jgi:hypothetical protein
LQKRLQKRWHQLRNRLSLYLAVKPLFLHF